MNSDKVGIKEILEQPNLQIEQKNFVYRLGEALIAADSRSMEYTENNSLDLGEAQYFEIMVQKHSYVGRPALAVLINNISNKVR